MPIYAYRCGACGLDRDVLQKISDPVLTVCPECGAEAFAKQLTAAGFQLKGSGWYVTDFRDGGNKAKSGEAAPSEGADGGSKAAEASQSSNTTADAGSSAAAPSPAPAASSSSAASGSSAAPSAPAAPAPSPSSAKADA